MFSYSWQFLQTPSACYPSTDLKLQHVHILTRIPLLHQGSGSSKEQGSGSSEEQQAPELHQCSAWWPPCWCGHPCLFSSFGYQSSQKWASFMRPFATLPAWLTLALAAHHSSVKFTYFSWRQSHTGCLEIVMSTGIAQHFPYLVLLPLDCLISSCVGFLWLRKRMMDFWHLQVSCHLQEGTWN